MIAGPGSLRTRVVRQQNLEIRLIEERAGRQLGSNAGHSRAPLARIFQTLDGDATISRAAEK